MNAYLGELFAKAALRVIRKAKYRPADIDAVGSHGQTIHHLPKGFASRGGPGPFDAADRRAGRRQERTGITTVANFRPRDMAAGRRRAPVPLCSCGGVPPSSSKSGGGEYRWDQQYHVSPAGARVHELRAFDTGPGNMVLDAIMRAATRGAALRCRGRLARRGMVNQGLLREPMAHPFGKWRPPKSTGREEFGAPFVQALIARQHKTRLSLEDLLATCAAWTAEAIGSCRRWISGEIDEVIVGGGGSTTAPSWTRFARCSRRRRC